MRWSPFILAILLSEPVLAAEAVGAATPIGPAFCRAGATEASGRIHLSCPGPAGVEAHLFEEGGRSGVSLGSESGPFTTFGETNRLGQTMEWRLADGRPFAGIVRYRLPGEGGGEATGDLLAILKVAEGDRPGCLVAVVDATVNPDSREMARRIADERAPAFFCGTDEARIVGMSSDWARAIALPRMQR